jgi:hypothetical protein
MYNFSLNGSEQSCANGGVIAAKRANVRISVFDSSSSLEFSVLFRTGCFLLDWRKHFDTDMISFFFCYSNFSPLEKCLYPHVHLDNKSFELVTGDYRRLSSLPLKFKRQEIMFIVRPFLSRKCSIFHIPANRRFGNWPDIFAC